MGMKSFTVSKGRTSESSDAEPEVHITPVHEEPPKARYATRFIFWGLLISGGVLITFGITLLMTCRNKVNKQTCGVALSSVPCADLAVSAYFGCVLILATILGFGCVGRKAMAAMLIPFVIGEVMFSVYILAFSTHPVDKTIYKDISDRGDSCFGLNNATYNFNDTQLVTTTTEPISMDIFSCWKRVTSHIDECVTLWQFIGDTCHVEENNRSLEIQRMSEGHARNCTHEVNRNVRTTVWNKTLIIGPLLLFIALVHTISAVCLWRIRKSTSWKRGWTAIHLPHLPKRLKRTKRSVKIGTNNLDQSQSLIYQPNDSVVNMQKYVFSKLRRQKNTYATV